MDLTSLSLGKLNTLKQRIAREIEVRERVGKVDVIKKLRKLAAAEGFTLEELLSLPQQAQATPPAKAKRTRKAVAKQKAPLPIRYAHPGNPELKWSGRGRRPSWVEVWAQNGGAMSALENAAERLSGSSLPAQSQPIQSSVEPVAES